MLIMECHDMAMKRRHPVLSFYAYAQILLSDWDVPVLVNVWDTCQVMDDSLDDKKKRSTDSSK